VRARRAAPPKPIGCLRRAAPVRRLQRDGGNGESVRSPTGRPSAAHPEIEALARPRPSLRRRDVVALVVGIVVGAGIFRAPAVVAAAAGDSGRALFAWALGGAVSIAGAMCYAELAAAFPHAGGEYHFLKRALGRSVAFLFGWARLTVIPTGSVALLAFVFGDYASQVVPLGAGSSAIWAAVAVVALAALNVAGLRAGAATQNALTVLVVLGLGAVIAAGLAEPPAPVAAARVPGEHAGLGVAMVFVLLTYGGWNEAAYVSAEVKGGRRAIAGALVLSLVVVAALYLLVNAAYLRALGAAGTAASPAVAAELLARALGPRSAVVLSLVVCAAALTSANATLLMGSRSVYALGRDWPAAAALGRWSARAETPVNAVCLQALLALALVGFGAVTRAGFESMVSYTAPVFWLFFLLTGASVFVLRAREPAAERPFRVPLYPLTPALFCAACAWLLWSSLVYTGAGALLGVAVLAAGVVPLWLSRTSAEAPRRPSAAPKEEHA
jgi:amino acid transporter